METIEDKIYRLIDEQQFTEAKEIAYGDPHLLTLVRDVIYIKNGLDASRVELLTEKLQNYENDLNVIEDVLVKSRKFDQVNTLTDNLKSFEEEKFTQAKEPKSGTKTFSLKSWYKYAAAASIIFVLSIGLLRNMSSSFDLDQYYIESSSLTTRSDSKSSKLLDLAASKKWKAMTSSNNLQSLTMLENYHLGIAYMYTDEHLKSIEYLDMVVASRLPEYEELALYHKMINLYLLDDSKYQEIQSVFLQNPENRFYSNSKKLSE